ncbi:hypothetical protein Hanom_Chr08g00719301 [Helianthus anomalus]
MQDVKFNNTLAANRQISLRKKGMWRLEMRINEVSTCMFPLHPLLLSSCIK